MGGVLGIHQDRPLVGVGVEPALQGGGVGILHGQVPPDGLLFQPFPGVALGDTGGRGQPGRVERAHLRQDGLQPEPPAQVDADHLQLTDGRLHHPFVESRAGRFDHADHLS